jgi:hypothetical protein
MRFHTLSVLMAAACMALSTVCAALPSAAANKAPDPVLKPGHWEIVSTHNESEGNRMTTETRCAGPRAKEARLVQQEREKSAAICTFSPTAVSARSIAYTAKCDRGEGYIATQKVVYAGDFKREFTKTSTLSLSIPTPLEGTGKTESFKYMGACPKTMKAGDTVVFNPPGRPISTWNRYAPPDAKAGVVPKQK